MLMKNYAYRHPTSYFFIQDYDATYHKIVIGNHGVAVTAQEDGGLFYVYEIEFEEGTRPIETRSAKQCGPLVTFDSPSELTDFLDDMTERYCVSVDNVRQLLS
jgi:hypothetical protein